MKKSAVSLLLAGALCSGVAQAALHDRGGGLLYDDVLNVTWLQDASHAKTSGYDADGLMTWSEASRWAENLNFFDSVRKTNLAEWRLASNGPVRRSPPNATNAPLSGEWLYEYSNSGLADSGYNITSANSELSFMYYVNLGLDGYFRSNGSKSNTYGVFGNGKSGGQNDIGLVRNLQSGKYWSRTHSGLNSSYAFYFSYADGRQDVWTTYSGLSAWAVHPGDVAAVAEPEVHAMLLAGLFVLGGVSRRRQKC